MAVFSNLIITNKGKELLNKDIYSTPDSIIFTKVKTTAETIDKANIPTMTDLRTVAQTCTIGGVSKLPDNTVRLAVNFENKDVAVAYTLKAVGIYAKASNTAQEILYAVALEESNNYIMPKYNGLRVNALSLTFYIKVDSTETISLTVDPGAYITARDIDAKIDSVLGRLAKDMKGSTTTFNDDGTITTENSTETVTTTFNADDSVTEKHVYKDGPHTTVTLKTRFTDNQVITEVVK